MSDQPQQTVTVKIDFEDKVWLADYARRQKLSMQDVLRALIKGLREANTPTAPTPEAQQ